MVRMPEASNHVTDHGEPLPFNSHQNNIFTSYRFDYAFEDLLLYYIVRSEIHSALSCLSLKRSAFLNVPCFNWTFKCRRLAAGLRPGNRYWHSEKLQKSQETWIFEIMRCQTPVTPTYLVPTKAGTLSTLFHVTQLVPGKVYDVSSNSFTRCRLRAMFSRIPDSAELSGRSSSWVLSSTI